MRNVVLCSVYSVLLSTSVSAAPPIPPDSLRALSNSSGHIEIYWSQAYDDGYIVGYELVKNDSAILVGDVTEYYDSDTGNDSSYTYRIVAIDNDGERAASSSTVTIAHTYSGSTSSVSSVSVSSSSVQSISGGTQCIDEDGDGWGWDGYQSCVATEPVSLGAKCVDPDGDGWGWDGSQSCVVVSQGASGSSEATCVDSDGDGWGWDGGQSCRPK